MACKEPTMCANSTIICEEIYEEPDLGTEDSHVTIIIHDTSTTDENYCSSLEPSDMYFTLSSGPPVDADHIRRSLRECLRLASDQETEVQCFLCPETYQSFANLKKHFTETHDLTQSITHLANIPSEYITLMAKEVKHLECSCTGFFCKTCNTKFTHILPLMQHVLVNHPTTYGSFPFFMEKQKGVLKKCQQCTILEKLCYIDYDLFLRILFDQSESSDESCKVLLTTWPLANNSEPCLWCAEEGEQGEVGLSELPDISSIAKREVVCYRIKQGLKKKCLQKARAPVCICPILKCPDCPKTVANYADLCKHIRVNGHSSWQDMRILWDKYKIIKENCPVCPKYLYHCYIVCPHCPQVALGSEKAAQAHMDSEHKNQAKNKAAPLCSCPNSYTCLKCSTSHPTPQRLYHHLQKKQHVTEENLAAIPAMIQRTIKNKRECPRCSLSDSGNTSDSCQKEECSCRWVQCSTCKTSFRKVSSFLDHIDKVKHIMSASDIKKEKEKLASSVKTCRRCCIEVDRCCVLCHQREHFLGTHMKTYHQDHQIMLLNDSGTFVEEPYTKEWDRGRLARYQCSECLLCFPSINKLRHHVRLQHPHRYFILFCLDLSGDVLQVKDFAAHEELMVLNIVTKSS